jgi:hypothetical protein
MTARTRVGALAGAMVFALAALVASVPVVAHAADGGVSIVEATIDGREVGNANDGDPIQLDPDRTPNVVVRVRNDGTEAVSIRSVRLEARAFGLPFVSLENRVDRTIPPGGSEEIRFPLETSGLRGQATGLLATTLTLLDDDRDTLADTAFVTDVRGSLWSIEGVFGLTALLFTIASLALGLVDMARHRLSPNRWWRAVRFAVPGLTFAVAFTFGLAAVRFVSPRAIIWIPLVLIGGIGGFAAGWLTPTPVDDRVIDLPALERAAAEAAALAAPAPGALSPAPASMAVAVGASGAVAPSAAPALDPGAAAQLPPAAPPAQRAPARAPSGSTLRVSPAVPSLPDVVLDGRDSRRTRDIRDSRDIRDGRDRADGRDIRDSRDSRNGRDGRDEHASRLDGGDS